VDLKLTFCPAPHYPQSTLTPLRNTSPRKNPHSLGSITNAELRYRKDRRYSSRTHHLAQNTVSTISTHLYHYSYASHLQIRSPIVLFSASENISSSFSLHHGLRISLYLPRSGISQFSIYLCTIHCHLLITAPPLTHRSYRASEKPLIIEDLNSNHREDSFHTTSAL
jgi:hypothetical protein